MKSRHVNAAGQERIYESALLRRTYRQGGKVRNQTLANLSSLPNDAVDLLEASLKGQTFVPADAAVRVGRSVPHGHVAAVAVMARKLGLPELLGPAGRARDLTYALILSRVVAPASKLATASWWADASLGEDLGVGDASTDELYQAMDWLAARQDHIEKVLAARHLSAQADPQRMALFDLSSSWMEGSCCELAARGYSRDGKKGKTQIEYGLLTDPDGRPVAVRVFPGNTADPASFTEIITALQDTLGLTDLVMVGDRGMITSARIAALAELDADSDTSGSFGWITALRAPAIAKLAADDGPLQLSLFDQQNLAEISHPDYPDERLIACRNPYLAVERARTREDLLSATEAALAPIAARVAAGRLAGADAIGLAVGKVINKYKVAKHLQLEITEAGLAYHRDQTSIDAEAGLDGIYVIRTSVPAETLDAPGVVTAYKNLAGVERDFRHLKIDDLDLRPIRHYLTERVKAHVLICMLACYLVWHLRAAWAELTFADEHPPDRVDPVAPATRSASAQAKASRHHDPAGQPVHSFTGLLAHLATLTRNELRFAGTDTSVPTLAEPTATQQRAFDLIGTTIPLACA